MFSQPESTSTSTSTSTSESKDFSGEPFSFEASVTSAFAIGRDGASKTTEFPPEGTKTLTQGRQDCGCVLVFEDGNMVVQSITDGHGTNGHIGSEEVTRRFISMMNESTVRLS